MLQLGANFSSKYTKMRLRPGLHSGSHWRRLLRCPDPQLVCDGLFAAGEGKGGERRKGSRREEKDGKGRGRRGSDPPLIFFTI